MPAQALASPSSASKEYLSFALGGEEYAIDILCVREIRGYEPVTRIANAPPFVKGVTNLRGAIVPIVDLRLRFGLEAADYGPFTVVIVLDLGTRTVGVVVDTVSDVVTLEDGQIQPPPAFVAGVANAFIRGLAGQGAQMLVVLDIVGMMLAPEMGLVDAAPSAEAGKEQT